jgi:hypothetical protein
MKVRLFYRAVAVATLSTFTAQVFALQANIVVNRIDADRYLVVKGENMKPNQVEIRTKYCHAYPHNEEALVVTAEETYDKAAVLFASGDECEVVSVIDKSRSDFSLIDFLLQLGIAYATKGAVKPTAKPVPKR